MNKHTIYVYDYIKNISVTTEDLYGYDYEGWGTPFAYQPSSLLQIL